MNNAVKKPGLSAKTLTVGFSSAKEAGMLHFSRPALFFLIVAVFTGTALADPSIVTQPPLNTFKLRTDLAAAGIHPRLYFTKSDTTRIRQRARGSCKWFYDHAKQSFGGYAGTTPDPPGTWKDYLFGFWGQFSMCMFYLVEGDTLYASTARNWALYYARRSDWLADDLVPMDITSGMALTYDILYDYLTASERAELRTALKRSIDTIMPAFFVGNYWTEDFDNNHMHNRIHGLAHAAFAMYGDDPAISTQTAADLAVGCYQQVATWLADDGSTHEGPGYWDYGYHWVVGTGELITHVTGVDPRQGKPHFAADHLYRLYMSTPGWKSTFGIGDADDGPPDNIDTWMVPIARARDAQSDSVFRRLMHDLPGSSYQLSMWGLFWYNDTLQPRPYSSLPLYRFWPDLEMFSIRSSWDDTATAFVFKCGPPGGNRLQQLRGTGYANVAHDHPDQNHFLLYANGRMLAQDDGYPTVAKLTRSHNTIVVDTQGQRRDGEGWYQPFSYDSVGHLDDIMLSGASALAAGNATLLYWGTNRFVRHIAFVEGTYVVSIDDLVGKGTGSHLFDWRLHKAGIWAAGTPGQFVVNDSNSMCLEIRFLEPAASAIQSAFLPAELTAQPCLSAKISAPSTRITAVLTPQKNGAPSLACAMIGATGCAAVSVQGNGFSDVVAMRTAGSTSFTAGDITSDATNALVRKQGSLPTVISCTRATMVTVAGKTMLGSNMAANLSWRSGPGIFTVEAEPAYKATGGNDTITIGGLTAERSYSVTIGDIRAGSAAASAAGTANAFVNLTARSVIILTDESAVATTLSANTGRDVRIRPVHGGFEFLPGDLASPTSIEVFDQTGRMVWGWEGIAGRGDRIMWNGVSLDGRTATPAAYLVRIRAGGTTRSAKVVLVK